MNSITIKLTDGEEKLVTEMTLEEVISCVFSKGEPLTSVGEDDEQIKTFVNPTFVQAITSTTYVKPPSQQDMLAAMEAFNASFLDKVETSLEDMPVENVILFEGDDGGIYSNDGTTVKPPTSNKGSHAFYEDDYITIV